MIHLASSNSSNLFVSVSTSSIIS
uniref:Uncharacterized protein n=1 Tax=Arundo donax TaxID=35708 RepID=A0A0A9BY65_ARUDO